MKTKDLKAKLVPIIASLGDAYSALETLLGEADAFVEEQEEDWAESDKGEEFTTMVESIREARDSIDSAKDDLDAL